MIFLSIIFIFKVEYTFNKFAFEKIITYFCSVTYNDLLDAV